MNTFGLCKMLLCCVVVAWGLVHLACVQCPAGSLVLEFDQPGGSILDANGVPVGFSARLPGTSSPLQDSALLLNDSASRLQMATTVGDPNGGAGVGNLSMPGVQLSTLGYTGKEDFSATVIFDPFFGLEPIDQVGLYVGNDIGNMTRAGMIQFDQPEYYSVHTTNNVDNNGRFFGAGIVTTDGMEVTIQRIAGDWQYFIDGLEWQPNSINSGHGFPVDPNGLNGSPNLDASADLYVGIYALTVFNSNTKFFDVDRFSVTVVPEPSWNVFILGLVFAGMFRINASRRPGPAGRACRVFLSRVPDCERPLGGAAQ